LLPVVVAGADPVPLDPLREACQRRSNSLAGGFGAEVIPYLDADVIP
jgi:hypothetical protein